MICSCPGQARHAFSRVQATHLTPLRSPRATEVPCVPDVSRQRAEEVSIECNYDVGSIEVIDRLERATESELRARIDVVPVDWLVIVDPRARKTLLQCFELTLKSR